MLAIKFLIFMFAFSILLTRPLLCHIMKKIGIALLSFHLLSGSVCASQWIRVNQEGYLPDDVKVAVWLTDQSVSVSEFQIVSGLTDKVMCNCKVVQQKGAQGPFSNTARLNFSEFKQSGSFYIKAGTVKSPVFRIGNDVYSSAVEVPLKYMRQQRCGFNPFLNDSCHKFDGRIVDHPTRTAEKIDARGGWHDASDYLQYVTTSANAIYQMLFAYSQYPKAFADNYRADGLLGSNGIPDVLDEAKWGLDWLLRMNPDKDTFFNQIADDRDHAGFKLPTNDVVDYGWGKGKDRPVYFCTGQKQGLLKHKNRTTGLASTVGKFASAFSLGADLLANFYPEYSKILREKSVDAYNKGVEFPGVCQTACCVSPYFYEEDNWTDDMQLAAAQIYKSTGDKKYLKDAVLYGRMEPVTPWMGADSARHYQWYPFVNIGHYQLASQDNPVVKNEFIRNLRSGLERVRERAGDDVFLNGIPFIWCSNNLTVALITQCNLYRRLTGNTEFLEMETAMRDWLFGCNPWGKCMIVGLPSNGDYPLYPHSAFSQLYHYPIDGGLVDGPVYTSIFKNLRGVHLGQEDKYAAFQSDKVVYHDDYADYSTNEPTMDGTASLSYYLAYLASEASSKDLNKRVLGGIIQGDTSKKKIALVFTGHEFADGGNIISKALKKQNIKGSFFLTGDFYRSFPKLAKSLQKNGHYLAPHSDKHILYADWGKRDSTLITREAFRKDLKDNYQAMIQAGVNLPKKLYFLPAYEWYNNDISSWCSELGVQLINFTPGTGSNADYTVPEMKSYKSSEEIYQNILNYEQINTLNGFMLLFHIGTDQRRTDKFYNYLDKLIKTLKSKGYEFTPVDKLL